jgi:hypothetical protein
LVRDLTSSGYKDMAMQRANSRADDIEDIIFPIIVQINVINA